MAEWPAYQEEPICHNTGLECATVSSSAQRREQVRRERILPSAEGVDPLGNLWWWLEALASVTSVVWMGCEGLSQYRMARQRLRLGLCDPLVCNPYLLWGLAGVTWTIW